MTEDEKSIGDVVLTVTPKSAVKYTCMGYIGLLDLTEEVDRANEPATFAFTPHFALDRKGTGAGGSKKGRDDKLEQTEKFVFHGFKVAITGDPVAPGDGAEEALHISAEGMSPAGTRLRVRLTILLAIHLVHVLRRHIRNFTMIRVADIAEERGIDVNSMSDSAKEALAKQWLLPPKDSRDPCRLRVVMTIPNATKYSKAVVAAIYQQALSYACSAVFGPSSEVDVDAPPTHAFPAAHVRIVFESEASVSCVMTPDQKFNPSEVPKVSTGQHFIVADAGGSTLDLLAVWLTTREDVLGGRGGGAGGPRSRGSSLTAGAGASSSAGSGSAGSSAASERGLEAVLPNDGLAMGAAHVDRMLEEWIDTKFAADKEHPSYGLVKFSIIQAFAKRRIEGEKTAWNSYTDDVDAVLSDHFASKSGEGSGAGSASGTSAGKRSASGSSDGRPAKKSRPSVAAAGAGSGVSPLSISDVRIRWTWSEEASALQLRDKYFHKYFHKQQGKHVYELAIPGSLIQEWYDTVFLSVIDKIMEYSQRTRAQCAAGELCPVFCTGGMAQFLRFRAMLKHASAIGEARTKEVREPQMSVLVGLFQPSDSQYRLLSRISESAIYVAAHPITAAEAIHPAVREVHAYRVCKAGERQVLNALQSFRLNFPACSPHMNIYVYAVPAQVADTLGAQARVAFTAGQEVPPGHLDGLRYACGVHTVFDAKGDHGYLTFQLGDCFVRAFLHIPAEKETHPAVFVTHNVLADYRDPREGYKMGPHVPEALGRAGSSSAWGQGGNDDDQDDDDEPDGGSSAGRSRKRGRGASDLFGPPPGLVGSLTASPAASPSGKLTAKGSGTAAGQGEVKPGPGKRGRPRKASTGTDDASSTAGTAIASRPGSPHSTGRLPLAALLSAEEGGGEEYTEGRRSRGPSPVPHPPPEKVKGPAKGGAAPVGASSPTPRGMVPAPSALSGPPQPLLHPTDGVYNHGVLVEGNDVKAKVTALCYPTQIVKNSAGEDVEVVAPGAVVISKNLKVKASTYEHAALVADLWRIKLDGVNFMKDGEPLNFPHHAAVLAALDTEEARAGGRHGASTGGVYTLSQAKNDGSACKNIAGEQFPETVKAVLAALAQTSAGGKGGKGSGKR